MDNIEEQLVLMLDRGRKTSRPINSYISNNDIVVYVRVTRRYINNELCNTVDIANITVNFDKQNSGIFKEFLSMVEKLSFKYQRTIFIESVLSELLIEKLPTYGYTMIPDTVPPSFSKNISIGLIDDIH